MSNYNRLYLVKICLCCFLDMLLYSHSLYTIATIFSLKKLELFPACFPCNIKFNLSHNSLGLADKKFVFETPEAETIHPCDLSNFITVQSQVDLLPGPRTSKCISFGISYINVSSNKLALSTL